MTADTNNNCNVDKEFYCKPSIWLYLAISGALLSASTVGLTSGYASPAVVSMESNHSHPHYDHQSDVTIESWIRSSPLFSGMIGALSGGFFAGLRGSRICLIVVCLPLLLGWLLIGFAETTSMIIIGRLITGFVGGIHCAVVPGFISELSPAQYRGLFGTLFQAFVNVGILVSSFIGAFAEWKLLAIVSSIPCFMIAVSLYFVPDSPVYLFNKYGACKLTLEALEKYRTKESNCNAELELMASTPREKLKAIIDYSDLKKPYVYKPLILSMIVLTVPQAMGICAIVFNEKDIFIKSNITIDADVCSIVLNFIVVIVTGIGALLTKIAKRKTLLLISSIGSSLSMAVLSMFFFLSQSNSEFGSKYGLIALFSTIFYMSFFNIGWSSLPWVIVPEICPYFASGFIMACGCFMNWFSAFLVTNQFESLEANLTEGGTFALFSIVCAIAIAFGAICLPETKNKTNEQILIGFGKENCPKYPMNIKSAPIACIS